MGAQLLGLPRAEVLVRVTVLPHQSAPLVLNETPLRSLDELTHDLEGVGLPCVIRVLHHAVPLVVCCQWQFVVKSTFRGEPDALDVGEPLLQHFAVPAAEDHDCVVGVVGTESLQALNNLLVGRAAVAFEVVDMSCRHTVLTENLALVGRQSALVVQEKHPVLRLLVSPQHFAKWQLHEILPDANRANLRTETNVLDAYAFFLPRPAQVGHEVLEPIHGRILRAVQGV
mmetsp:Transcript_73598/g.204529  ORF Transcript_73598/g.204529 Transcript_73598/m.204529 type:complete len:228 (-) Transcript_73598:2067-2750(-)